MWVVSPARHRLARDRDFLLRRGLTGHSIQCPLLLPVPHLKYHLRFLLQASPTSLHQSPFFENAATPGSHRRPPVKRRDDQLR